MEIPLCAEDQAARRLQQRKQPRVFFTRSRERLRDGQIDMRQPAGPTHVAHRIAPLSFHAGEIGEHVDGGVLRQLVARGVACPLRRKSVGQFHRVIQRRRPRSRAQHDRTQVRRHARREDRECRAFHFGLILHHLIARHKRFETIARRDMRSLRERTLAQQIFPANRFDWAIKHQARLGGTHRVGEHRLGSGFVRVRQLEQLARPLWTRAPIGRSGMAGHQQIALRRRHGINRQRRQTGDELVLRHITSCGLDELGAPNFPAGFAGDQDIPAPPLRTEDLFTATNGFVKMNPARRLMLRAIVEHTRLINNSRKVDGMPRRKSVVPPFLDMQEFVERISIR